MSGRPDEWEGLIVKPLSEEPRKGAFCCGQDEIDKWFWKKSYDEHVARKSRVTIFREPVSGSLIGFHCLSLRLEDEKLLDNSRKSLVRASNRLFAALRAEYLAVDIKFQKQGYGPRIFRHALDVFYQVITLTGLQIMVLTCIDKEKIRFYEQFGFTQYGRDTSRPFMLLPAADVIEAYRAAETKT